MESCYWLQLLLCCEVFVSALPELPGWTLGLLLTGANNAAVYARQASEVTRVYLLA